MDKSDDWGLEGTESDVPVPEYGVTVGVRFQPRFDSQFRAVSVVLRSSRASRSPRGARGMARVRVEKRSRAEVER